MPSSLDPVPHWTGAETTPALVAAAQPRPAVSGPSAPLATRNSTRRFAALLVGSRGQKAPKPFARTLVRAAGDQHLDSGRPLRLTDGSLAFMGARPAAARHSPTLGGTDMSERIAGWAICLGFCASAACGRGADTVPDALPPPDATDGAVEDGNSPACPTFEELASDQRCTEAIAGTRCFYPCNGGNIVWTVCSVCRREDPNYYWCGYKTEKC